MNNIKLLLAEIDITISHIDDKNVRLKTLSPLMEEITLYISEKNTKSLCELPESIILLSDRIITIIKRRDLMMESLKEDAVPTMIEEKISGINAKLYSLYDELHSQITHHIKETEPFSEPIIMPTMQKIIASEKAPRFLSTPLGEQMFFTSVLLFAPYILGVIFFFLILGKTAFHIFAGVNPLFVWAIGYELFAAGFILYAVKEIISFYLKVDKPSPVFS